MKAEESSLGEIGPQGQVNAKSRDKHSMNYDQLSSNYPLEPETPKQVWGNMMELRQVWRCRVGTEAPFHERTPKRNPNFGGSRPAISLTLSGHRHQLACFDVGSSLALTGFSP